MKIITFFLTLSFVIAHTCYANSPNKESYKTAYDIPIFIDIKGPINKSDFIESIYNSLQEPLISGPRAIAFIDSSGYVSRKGLEKYKRQALKKIKRKQKRSMFKLDQNNDGVVSLEEYLSQKRYALSDMVELYHVAKKFGVDAKEKHAPITQKLRAQIQGQGHRYIVKNHMALFMELDKNNDDILSNEEINTPAPSAVEKETSETIAHFESLLSLSPDEEKTSLDDVYAAIKKAFNTLDVNKDNVIERFEHRALITAFRPKHSCPKVRLSNEGAYTYAVAIGKSRVFTPIQFYDTFKTQTNYAEVEIKKQKQPLNLVLSARNNTIWSIVGDVNSIRRVIIIGPGEERDVYSGALGVPKEKITFANRHDCWNTGINRSKDDINKKNYVIQGARNALKSFAGEYPHLFKTQNYASKITIQSTPKIILSENLSKSLKAVPEGYNPSYWAAFLKDYVSGFKDLEMDGVIAGAYAYKSAALPSWFGIAQLQHDGIIEPLNINSKNRTAAFLINKDLPYYVLPHGLNHTFFTFIKNDESLSIPDAETAKTSQFCVMDRQGNGLVNAKNCNVANLAFLKPKATAKQAPTQNPVFLSLGKYSVVMPAGQETIDIKLNMDEQLCRQKYGEDFAQQCVLPASITSEDFPIYALKIEPAITADVAWKDRNTIRITPKNAWDINRQYSVTINLDHLSAPKGYMINNARSAKTKFFSGREKVTISNVSAKNNLHNAQAFILAMDISSNVAITDLDINLFHVPEDSIRPDEHVILPEKDYIYFSKGHASGPEYYDVSPTEKRLEIEFMHREDGLSPTHLFVYNGTLTPIWVPLNEIPITSPKISALFKKAQDGDSKSQIELAQYYWSGKDTPIVLSKVRYWLEAAATQGNVDAYALLGDLNFNRYDQEHDRINEAFYWYMKAAKENHKHAQFRLGEIHSYINRPYYDEDEMMKWYSAAEKNGHTLAMNKLGSIYLYGLTHTKRDFEKAAGYFKKAADLKDPLAMSHLSMLAYEEEEDNTNLDKAYRLAKQAFDTADRSDVRILDRARKVIVNVLLDKYTDEKNIKAKIEKISHDVFKDFKNGYQRMWIASAFLTKWDGKQDMFLICDALIQKQKEETPDLAELMFVEMWLNLKRSYRSGDQYESKAREDAIELFEAMRGNTEFDTKVIDSLAYLYISKRDGNTLRTFLTNLTMKEYIPFQKLSYVYSIYIRQTGQISDAIPQTNDPEDEYMAALEDREAQKDPAKMNQVYLDSLKENPNRAWTNGNYASFLLSEMKDYDGAIKYGDKAIEIMDYPLARYVTGMAYLVKASQLFKEKDTRSSARQYVEKAKSYGLHKSFIQRNCETFCNDIKTMLNAYNKIESQKPI